MKYKLLAATTAATKTDRGYDAATWSVCDDLYQGGFQILEKAKEYLPQVDGENGKRYNDRLAIASYPGYFGQIVNMYSAAAFAQPLTVVPAGDADDPNTPGTLPEPDVWQGFAKDADLQGCAFPGVLQQAFTTALVKGKALVACDFPPAGDEGTRADSDASGVDQPYVYEMPVEELTSWEYASQFTRAADLGNDSNGQPLRVRFSVGKFAWCIVKRTVVRHPTPEEPAKTFEEYRIWVRDPETGKVSWSLYEIEIDEKKGPPNADADVPVKEGPVETTFAEIPIVEIKLPKPLWIGNVIGPMCRELWQRRSCLLASQIKALFVLPVAFLGPQTGAFQGPIPAQQAEDPTRGNDPKKDYESKGWKAMVAGDDLRFISPPTDAFTVVDGQLKDLVDEIFRCSGRMASSISNTSTALGRSGESKAEDNGDFCVVLKALGAIFRDAARRIYTILSTAREEDVKWVVHGLDSFDPEEDRASVIDELIRALPAMPGPGVGITFFSKTAKVEFVMRAYLKLLPGLTPETQAQVRAETVAAIEKAEADAAAATAAAAALAQQPPPGGAPTPPAGPKPPTPPAPPVPPGKAKAPAAPPPPPPGAKTPPQPPQPPAKQAAA